MLPDYFTRYKSEHLKTVKSNRKNKTFYEDLNNDNRSEKIVYYENNLGNASFEIHNADGSLIDQWNFNSQHCSKNPDLWIFDSDHDGFNEIFHFTKRKLIKTIIKIYIKKSDKKDFFFFIFVFFFIKNY